MGTNINTKSKITSLVKTFQIRLVLSTDLPLIAEYNLESLPALVFYRHQIPILYEGNVFDENDVKEWLLINGHTGDASEKIEDTLFENLDTLIDNFDELLVFFYDKRAKN